MDVLYCSSTQVQASGMYEMGIPKTGASKVNAEISELCNQRGYRLCGHADGDCLLLISDVYKLERSGDELSDLTNGERGGVLIPVC